MNTKIEVPQFTGTHLKIQMKKSEGDFVSSGEVVCVIEFDAFSVGSAEVDIEADCNGRISWLTKDRSEVTFGQEIAIIES